MNESRAKKLRRESAQKIFEEWWEKEGLPHLPFNVKSIAKAAWNKALELACDRFCEMEGTDYNAWEMFEVKYERTRSNR